MRNDNKTFIYLKFPLVNYFIHRQFRETHEEMRKNPFFCSQKIHLSIR